MKLGLFGRPVSHSRSLRLFARLSRLLKRPISYAAVEVQPGELGAAIAVARDAGWRGVNVTIPLKEEAAALADSLTSEARALMAVNVLRFGRTVIGHNSDGEGLRDALRRAGVAVRGKDVLVFGAGGAARATGWAMGKEGARRVRFAARTASRARRAARDLGKVFPRTEFSAGTPVDAHLWVNATPLGMHGFPDRSPAPKSLPSPETAIDLVYGRRTAFQRDAAARGARVEDGAPMLVFQALRAWESWDRPLGAVRRAKLFKPLLQEVLIERALWRAEIKPTIVYLTGFMGVGKSAAGRTLARRLGRPFVELDAVVTRTAGASVVEIFARLGEKAFRRLEREALARAAKRRGAVVALGGGVLLDARNRAVIARTGVLVRLTCSRRELVRRLRPLRASRPLLAGRALDARVAFLLKTRRAAYANAGIAVSTTGLSAAAVAARIARKLT